MQSYEDVVPLYPPPADKPPMRVGVLLDSFALEAWAHHALAEIEEGGFAKIAAFVVNWERARRQPSALQNLLAGRAHASTELFWRYSVFDRARNDRTGSPFASVDLKPMIDGVPVIDVAPLRKGFVHRFRDEDVERLKRLELDVLLRFGFNILRGDILSAAPLGMWSYHHGDHTRYRGGPAMFWEMWKGESTCGTILQRLTEELDNGEVLYRSFARREASVWLSEVRRRPYWKSAAFISRSLRQAQARGEVPLERRGNEPEPKGKLYRTPGNLHMLRFLGRAAGRSLAGNLRSRTSQPQWFIASRRRPQDADPLERLRDPSGYKPIYPPKGVNFADPFLIAHEDQTWCFFESFPDGGRGRIDCIRFDDDGQPSAPKTALAVDYHLSYPYLFNWRGKIYLMPESGERNAVQVFEARRFPHDWTLHTEIRFGRPVYDPTVVEWRGLWYLFVSVDECGGGADDELFLFSGPTPLGPWRPHPRNPIVSDVRSARPAGQPFLCNGRLIRPAQDCSDSYGGAVALCEVDTLTEDDYSERVIGHVDSSWHRSLTGCHTINAAGGFEVIDGRRNRLRLGRVRR